MVVMEVPFDASVTVSGETVIVRVLEVDWFRIGETIIKWDGMGNRVRRFPTLKEAANAISQQLRARGLAVPSDLSSRFGVHVEGQFDSYSVTENDEARASSAYRSLGSKDRHEEDGAVAHHGCSSHGVASAELESAYRSSGSGATSVGPEPAYRSLNPGAASAELEPTYRSLSSGAASAGSGPDYRSLSSGGASAELEPANRCFGGGAASAELKPTYRSLSIEPTYRSSSSGAAHRRMDHNLTNEGTYAADGKVHPYKFSPELTDVPVRIVAPASGRGRWQKIIELFPMLSKHEASRLGSQDAIRQVLVQKIGHVSRTLTTHLLELTAFPILTGVRPPHAFTARAYCQGHSAEASRRRTGAHAKLPEPLVSSTT